MTTTDSLTSRLKALPKIDLHRHLEGSVRLETLIDIARAYDMTLPNYDVESLRPHVQIMPGEPRDWQHFLGKFLVLRQFFRSPDVIRRVTREVIEDAAADNVKYLELRFTPQALNNLLHCSFAEVLSWVCESASETAAAHGIHVSLIASMNRHESVEIGEQVLDAALANQCNGVAGLDLAGQEAVFSCRPFRALFERAKDAGLGITVHAGEWAGADSIRDAVDVLGADRIGHGIRVLEDPALVRLLAGRGTVFEVCPTSNVHSGVVASYDEHPIRQMVESGLHTTLNTDDPSVSGITLTDEFAAVVQECGMTLDQIRQQTLTAARAAFLPPDDRVALVRQFETLFASPAAL